MPCYQVNMVSLAFKAKNVDLLLKALERINLGVDYNEQSQRIRVNWDITINLKTQEVRYPDRAGHRATVNRLKRTYSEVVLEEAARRKKWLLKKKAEGKFQLKRF